ncbi:MAG: cupin domain-containing protein [Proteobacteria bacterium]|nr:cupin domain-containing protein [Pseudomonadota bacterium]
MFPSGIPLAHADEASRVTVVESFRDQPPNVPGKSLVGLVVTYPPGTKTPPHRHAPSAFITGFVLSGAIRSQVNDGPVQIFHAGESWPESPGAHHRISENASDTESASLLGIFVVDSKETKLTTLDKN